ncbi:hypothetical protein HK096_008288 [Nowakowskiella sp. JEL0078]|nr:hypothetical protein HK096_008288 [Nowakowskiella sp. JEL0078]
MGNKISSIRKYFFKRTSKSDQASRELPEIQPEQPANNNSSGSNHSGSNSHGSQVLSNADTIPLNEKSAEHWQPQFYHMMRPDARLDNKRRFHNIEKSPYPLPADIEEQDRLEAQHAVLTFCFGGLFQMPIRDVLSRPGARVLDVGCGPGSWTRDVAGEFPLCEVHALDMAKTLFNGVEVLPNTYFVEGNVLEGLPYPDNYFDGVFQRYLGLAYPKDKWEIAIKELYRVTKPGGFVECVEPDGKFERLGPNSKKLYDGVFQAMRLRGLDMDIYWNLPELFQKAGLVETFEVPASLPIGWNGRVGELNLINVKMIGDSLKPFLMKTFGMTSEDFDKQNSDALEEYGKFESYWNAISVVGRKA